MSKLTPPGSIILEPYQRFNIVPSEELEFGPVCGHGTFGQIRIARWNGSIVATKSFHYKQNFHAEIKHFPQDKHPNIIKLFGICPEHSLLVLEYAEIGSLYHILHERIDVKYYLSHAINWCLQAARGVSYLHSIKPKPMMHRDLKPPNLLVFDDGRVIKLCDFGTLRMVDTEVTNQTGSAAWMAPEVFQTKSYSEKCDVYSWGIILWEVLSRKKPYEDINETFRICWLVSSGRRPPLLKDCPEVLEKLMIRCWDKESKRRPDMHTVENVMQKLYDFYINEEDCFRSTTLHIPLNSPTSSQDDSCIQSTQSTLPSDVLNLSLPLTIDCNRPSSSTGTSSIINSLEDDVRQLRKPDQPCTSKPSIDLPQDKNQNHQDVAHLQCHFLNSYDTYNLLDGDDLGALLSPDLVPSAPDVYNTRSMQIYELHREEAKNYLQKYFNIIVLEENRNERLQRQKDNQSNGNHGHSLENLKSLLNQEKEKYIKMIDEQRISLQKAKERNQLRIVALEEGWVMVN